MTTQLDICLRVAQRMLPQRCLLCGAASGRGAICTGCNADLPRLPPGRCRVCALPLPERGVCGACLRHAPHFAGVTAAFAYRFPVDALIHGFKYSGNLSLGNVLAQALGSVVRERADLIVPMPLSRERLRQRGFNQAAEIARCVGRLTGIPVATGLCRKAVDTPAQAALPWQERARNVRGVFVCDADLGDRTIAVIDDVLTTGATLDELARTLRRAGAAAVSGWVVARALRQHSGASD